MQFQQTVVKYQVHLILFVIIQVFVLSVCLQQERKESIIFAAREKRKYHFHMLFELIIAVVLNLWVHTHLGVTDQIVCI